MYAMTPAPAVRLGALPTGWTMATAMPLGAPVYDQVVQDPAGTQFFYNSTTDRIGPPMQSTLNNFNAIVTGAYQGVLGRAPTLGELTAAGYVLLKSGMSREQFQAKLAATVAAFPGIVSEQLTAQLQAYAAALPAGLVTTTTAPVVTAAAPSTDIMSWLMASISANPWLWLGGAGALFLVMKGR